MVENAANPAALPDGSLLVARPNGEGRSQLTRVWPDTGRMQALPVDVTFDPGFRPWIRVSADGRRVVVALGRMYDTPGRRSLIEVDVAAGTAHPIEIEGNLEVRAVALSADGASAIAAVPANALTRIVRIPLRGPRVPEDLFTVTGDVWDLDLAASGAVDVNVADRPGRSFVSRQAVPRSPFAVVFLEPSSRRWRWHSQMGAMWWTHGSPGACA